MKWPRGYALEILAIRDRTARLKAIERVPRKFQALVRKHVELLWSKRKLHNSDT